MSDSRQYQYALFLLGAGFSKPAGLPLGPELFEEVRREARSKYGPNNALEAELMSYCAYLTDVTGSAVGPHDIDFEQFMGFLDVEHYLGLEGPETVSDEGNAAQLLLRTGIGDLLHRKAQAAFSAPLPLYEKFARLLKPRDVVLSLNYDTLLEGVFDRTGVPYRLFPTRLERFHPLASPVDNSRDEVILLKLHGSVNWFDRRPFDSLWDSRRLGGSEDPPRQSPFGDDQSNPQPLVDGPWDPEDPLLSIFRLGEGDPYWTYRGRRASPFILSPSYQKLLYSSPIHALWWGLGYAGTRCSRLCVIGYSIPDHDEYVRQALYSVVRGFNLSHDLADAAGYPKKPMAIIDYRASDTAISELRQRYRFAISDDTYINIHGFSEEALDELELLWSD